MANIIEVVAVGPQGPIGPAGPQGPEISSFYSDLTPTVNITTTFVLYQQIYFTALSTKVVLNSIASLSSTDGEQGNIFLQQSILNASANVIDFKQTVLTDNNTFTDPAYFQIPGSMVLDGLTVGSQYSAVVKLKTDNPNSSYTLDRLISVGLFTS